MNNSILDTIKIDRCCGCMVCKHVCPVNAITEISDEYGFIYPSVDYDVCINCGKCSKTCPITNEVSLHEPISAFAALNKDLDIVYNSSSGGVFASIAKEVLKKGGLVYGATVDSDWNVKHTAVTVVEDLPSIQKSKYVQSSLLNTFSEIKKALDNRLVLFSGTPCQVAALYCFLGDNYNNLLTVDFVCHGTPSNLFFKDYISFLDHKYGKIEKYTFRAKKQANNGMNWFSAIKPVDKKEFIINWPIDSYGYYYMKSKTNRLSCYDCQFAKVERASDITLCDYWGWENYHADRFEASSSVSGVIINSEKGNALFQSIISDLTLDITSYEKIAEHNRHLNSSEKLPLDRTQILSIWKNYGYKELAIKFSKEHRLQIIKYTVLDCIPFGIVDYLKKVLR